MKFLTRIVIALSLVFSGMSRAAIYDQPLPIVSAGIGAAASGTLYSILNGGTNGVLHGATNLYSALVTNSYYGGFSFVDTNFAVVFPVGMHADAGIMVRYSDSNVGATNANLILIGFQSFDGGQTFESKPSILLTNAFPTAVEQGSYTGFTNRTALFQVSVPCATHIGFQVGNTGSAAGQDVTNLVVNCNLNNKTIWTTPAPR